jgi:hypothetical protein
VVDAPSFGQCSYAREGVYISGVVGPKGAAGGKRHDRWLWQELVVESGVELELAGELS